ACVGLEVASEQLPVDLFAVIDRSGSMDDATASGVSKWSATRAAFHEFLEHAPAGMGFGLSLFPVPGDDTASCRTDHYRFAAMPISDVSLNANSAFTRLDAVKPQGQTPTAPALTAALDLATTYGVAHLDRSVVVVLATDGLPTTCAPTDAAALAELAQQALDGPAHVRTMVVASGSDAHAAGFARIAAAGGTLRPLVIDPRHDFARQMGDALGAAAARRVTCDLALPEPPPGRRLDYDAVNVVLDGDERITLPRVEGASNCDGGAGWYYDVDPNVGAPSRLNVCKAACDRVGSAAKLRVELGCETRVR
ncbi:MAG TPA: hypothetical protein VEQ59_00710, partial [Polyangiaceae bacterium]|nr:hypothetical protein [Polyangiaceae bacterium]